MPINLPHLAEYVLSAIGYEPTPLPPEIAVRLFEHARRSIADALTIARRNQNATVADAQAAAQDAIETAVRLMGDAGASMGTGETPRPIKQAAVHGPRRPVWGPVTTNGLLGTSTKGATVLLLASALVFPGVLPQRPVQRAQVHTGRVCRGAAE